MFPGNKLEAPDAYRDENPVTEIIYGSEVSSTNVATLLPQTSPYNTEIGEGTNCSYDVNNDMGVITPVQHEPMSPIVCHGAHCPLAGIDTQESEETDDSDIERHASLGNETTAPHDEYHDVVDSSGCVVHGGAKKLLDELPSCTSDSSTSGDLSTISGDDSSGEEYRVGDNDSFEYILEMKREARLKQVS